MSTSLQYKTTFTCNFSCCFTSMSRWELCLVLLLPLTLCLDIEVNERKTIGREPDVTPICTNATEHIITLIVCKIRTERREECRLLYQYGEDFVHQCDSRFTLVMENQTVFLHLTSLTPVDSGSYTCECSRTDATYILRLNITVEEQEAASSFTSTLIQRALIGVTTAVITITGLIFGLICKRKRDRSRSATSGLSVRDTPNSFDDDDPDDPYTSLQQPASDVYQTISRSNIERICFNNRQRDGRESDQSSEDLYENV